MFILKFKIIFQVILIKGSPRTNPHQYEIIDLTSDSENNFIKEADEGQENIVKEEKINLKNKNNPLDILTVESDSDTEFNNFSSEAQSKLEGSSDIPVLKYKKRKITINGDDENGEKHIKTIKKICNDHRDINTSFCSDEKVLDIRTMTVQMSSRKDNIDTISKSTNLKKFRDHYKMEDNEAEEQKVRKMFFNVQDQNFFENSLEKNKSNNITKDYLQSYNLMEEIDDDIYDYLNNGSFKKEYLYFKAIGLANSFDFDCLINCVNAKNKFSKRLIPSEYFEFKSYKEFFNILSRNICQNLSEMVEEYKLVCFYKYFYDYVISIKSIYSFYMIEEREKNENFYASLNRGLQANEITKEVFNKYVELFNSNSYSILFRIIPGLILINKGEEIFDIENDTAIIIKYFQLILCIFEDFRFKYFILKGRNEEYIQNLYSNCEFNQMILNISMIFRQIMTFSIVSLDLLRL
ncbi:hypothetical protein H311_02547 [Anncaliia algerae PRA109]|nr:hypothetical protein H311_02547 [Anncaliia algerae PRA109]